MKEVRNMKKVNVEIELDDESYTILDRIAKKLRLEGVGKLLSQELDRDLEDIWLWYERFA